MSDTWSTIVNGSLHLAASAFALRFDEFERVVDLEIEGLMGDMRSKVPAELKRLALAEYNRRTPEPLFDGNLYSTPEKYGMEVVAELGGGGGYEWGLVVVYRHKPTGNLYGYADAGCSCNSPLEGVEALGDLTEIRSVRDLMPLIAEVSEPEYTLAELLSFQRRVGEVLKGGILVEGDE